MHSPGVYPAVVDRMPDSWNADVFPLRGDDDRLREPTVHAEGTDPAAQKDTAHAQEPGSVASDAEMIVTHRLPLGSSGSNHLVIEERPAGKRGLYR